MLSSGAVVLRYVKIRARASGAIKNEARCRFATGTGPPPNGGGEAWRQDPVRPGGPHLNDTAANAASSSPFPPVRIDARPAPTDLGLDGPVVVRGPLAAQTNRLPGQDVVRMDRWDIDDHSSDDSLGLGENLQHGKYGNPDPRIFRAVPAHRRAVG